MWKCGQCWSYRPNIRNDHIYLLDSNSTLHMDQPVVSPVFISSGILMPIEPLLLEQFVDKVISRNDPVSLPARFVIWRRVPSPCVLISSWRPTEICENIILNWTIINKVVVHIRTKKKVGFSKKKKTFWPCNNVFYGFSFIFKSQSTN